MTSSRTVESCRCAFVYWKTLLLDISVTGTPPGLPRTHLRVCTPATPVIHAVAWHQGVAPRRNRVLAAARRLCVGSFISGPEPHQ
jgi:hypothetical protein